MTYQRLVAFASKVAAEARKVGSAHSETDADVRGWRLDSIEHSERTISGGSMNTEIELVSDEIWLQDSGELLLVKVIKSTVIGFRSTNSGIDHSIQPLTEEYARKRDGLPQWTRASEWRGGSRIDEGSRYYLRPKPGRPECLTISMMLSGFRNRLRVAAGPAQ